MKTNKSFKAAGLAALALTAVTWYDVAQAAYVTLNGQPLATSVAPITRRGRTLVPMRDIFEALGATVQWNSLTQSIVATRGTTTVNMQIGNRAASVNGQRTLLEQAPIIHNGSTLVPLRFVSEALGAQVSWDDARQVASVATKGGSGQEVAGARYITVPAGVVVPVKLDDKLSSATARKGQTFTATVQSEDPGDSEFPAGSKVEGVITDVHRKTKTTPGVLDLDFRSVILPGGGRVSLQGELVALDNKSVSHESKGRLVAKKSSGKDKLKIIGIGAGAGYVIGHLLLKKSGLWSAVIGGAAGYLYGQHKDKGKVAEAVVPEGTRLGVRVDRPVRYADTTGYADQRAAFLR